MKVYPTGGRALSLLLAITFGLIAGLHFLTRGAAMPMDADGMTRDGIGAMARHDDVQGFLFGLAVADAFGWHTALFQVPLCNPFNRKRLA